MIQLDQKTATWLAALMALWLVGAVLAVLSGLKRQRKAAEAALVAERLSALLGTAPALPLLVRASGSLLADRRLVDWFGIAKLPDYLDELLRREDVFLPEDSANLARDIQAAQRVGRSFNRSIRIQESTRVLMISGVPASEQLEPGGAILWFFDATESLQEIEHLEIERNKLNRALHALSALIEAAPFPMWHRGPDYRLALVNTAYVRAVEGQSASDVVSRGLELVDGRTGGVSPAAAAEAAQREGQVLDRTVPATIAGARRMIRIVDVPLGPAGVAGYAVDVDELEEARADLARFLNAQHDLLDRLSAGVAQFGADRSLTFYNQPFVRIFELEPEWLVDRPEFDRVLERMRDAQRVPEVRDFPSWKTELRGWFTQGEAIEEPWLLPGGTHLRVLAQPLPDGGLLLIFEDRTEQLQLASARDTLLRVRAATFDNLFEAVGVFASDGRLHSWNRRFKAVWNLDEQVLVTHPRVDALSEMVAPQLATPDRASILPELVHAATAERTQRSGRVALADGRHFEFAVVPLPDGNALFTMLDITASRGIEAALRERNEALEEAHQLKNDFVANMSYELRVPLTTIAGFAEMLAGGYAGPLEPPAREYVDAILSSVGRLGQVVEDVLDLTQGEAGSLPIAQEDVDMVSLLAEAAQNADQAARAKDIDFSAKIDPTLGFVKGDARRLAQAIAHVLRNAVSYTQTGGKVLMHASRDADQIDILISDNGPGIDAERRARIFDGLHRATAQARERKDSGSLGVGLPLARQLIEAHGGSIDLASETGQGTSVLIVLAGTQTV